MPTTEYGQTVDYYEDGDDSSLASGFTENDTGGIITVGSSGHIVFNLATVTYPNSNIAFNGSVSSHMRIGFRFLSASNIPNFDGLMGRARIQSDVGTAMIIADGRNAGDNTRQIEIRVVGGNDTFYTAIDGTEYAIRIEYVRNGTSTIELIEMTGHTVVATASGTTPDSPVTEIVFGGSSYPGLAACSSTPWYDDLIVDSSDPTTDLVFWGSASPPEFSPALFRQESVLLRR